MTLTSRVAEAHGLSEEHRKYKATKYAAARVE
jgi:hypothetical protein